MNPGIEETESIRTTGTRPAAPPAGARGNRRRLLALPLVGALALAACDEAQGPSAAPAPPPVTVSQPLLREIIDWDEYTGRFEAVEEVEVRARVSGYLESIHFVDGDIVEKGDLLFVIDPRPFEIALQEAEAQLRSAVSRQELASKNLERARPLVDRGAIPVEEFDERFHAEREAAAAVEAARADVSRAQLDLDFTQVRSPVTGRAGRHEVSIGNLISGGSSDSSMLTRIVSLDPIHFYFDAPEQAFLKYMRLDRAGERPSSREAANPVYLSLADEVIFSHEGFMDFVDNRLDAGTGTIRGRAVFTNGDGVFTPGLFARIRLLGSSQYEALLLPDEVIGTDQSRRFVYVVDDQGTVAYRQVRLGPVINGLRIIREGITEDDWIVVNGLQRARDGAKVTPQREALEDGGALSPRQ